MKASLGLLTGFLALALSGCGQVATTAPSVAMGPGSETSGYQLRLKNADGTPAIKVAVEAVAQDGWSQKVTHGGVVLARHTTDDSGRVRFDSLPTKGVAFEAAQGSAVVHQEISSDTAFNSTLTLRNGGSIRLCLQGNTTGIRGIYLEGTNIQARLQSDGSWVMPWVPGGDYALVVWQDDNIFALGRMHTDSARSVDTLLPVLPVILLDDFNLRTSQNLVGSHLGGGYWFAVGNGSGNGKNPVSNPDLGALREPGWSGLSLHVQLQVDTTIADSSAMLGMDFAQSAQGTATVTHDLTRVDSLAFMTRGRGNVSLRFLVPGWQENRCFYETGISLDGAWRRSAVLLDTVRVIGAGCPTWTTVRTQVTGIGFVAHRDAEIWIDDLALYGRTPNQLFPGLIW
jgi:hypothetical protein